MPGPLRAAIPWAALLFVLFLLRLTHRGILWVEEAYPAAAAIQMFDHGKLLFADFQFDKPPLSAAAYLLWGGHAGWPLRLAGAAYVTLCAWLAFALARRWWTLTEGVWAAALLAFYLTFGVPSAVMALAPDLLCLAPLLGMMLALAGRNAISAGVWLGLAVCINGKAILLAPLLLAGPRYGWMASLAGLLAGLAVAVLGFDGPAQWQQVWEWGAAYSRETPVAAPWREGVVRTLSWCGFHATAVVGAVLFFRRERHAALLGWVLLAAAAVTLGLRFSPRYYLLLLPPVTLAAARGIATAGPLCRAVLCAVLLIPAIRFGARYVQLAIHPDAPWADTAMNRDSAAAARLISARTQPGDTILVWGYRPDILVYTRLPLGTPYLDSQPLTGVLADRHLTQSGPTFPALAARNRAALVQMSPTWIADGLGPYNPRLAIAGYPELAAWLAENYEPAGKTAGTLIYRRRP
ncbi:MAG: hypothetical protein IT162_08430 [Bryobacterales bacterium]|nr:hypothetical protein [Bryobacterales bacterium]